MSSSQTPQDQEVFFSLTGSLRFLEGIQRIVGADKPGDILDQMLLTAQQVLHCATTVLYLVDAAALPAEGNKRSTPRRGMPAAETVLCPYPPGGPLDHAAAVPLLQAGLLGRVVQGLRPSGVYRVQELTQEEESPEGHPACLLALKDPACHSRPGEIPTALGVLTARCEPGHEPTGCTPQLLATLVNLTEHSLAQRYEMGRGASYVSSASHELRTPLTAIRAFCEMLADGDAGRLTQKQRRYVERIDASAAHLHSLVENVLMLQSLRFRLPVTNCNSVALRSFLEDAALFFDPLVARRNMDIVVNTSQELPKLVTDEERLRQALFNLIDNAIKFSPEGSRVQLSAALEPDGVAPWIRLSVADAGVGIAPEDQRHIFEEFFRVSGDGTGEPVPGTGLGLPTVQQITKLLGGRVEVESQLGTGSVFSLLLPLGPDLG